jgi:hypothetical protein
MCKWNPSEENLCDDAPAPTVQAGGVIHRNSTATDSILRTVRRLLIPAAALLTLAACGSEAPATINAGGTINGGVISIAVAGTYSYTLTAGTTPTDNPDFPFPGCADAHLLADDPLYLVSDSGSRDAIGQRTGAIYLTLGNWHASTFSDPATEAPYDCPWSLRLTPK